ncbi:MAG: class I SAM-dependent methyltransferase [Candidatus Moraniibacteriota bacterium]
MAKRIFPESNLAHHYLDGLVGLEIGASAHNPFGLDTKNVDIADEFNRSTYKKRELQISGEVAPIDIVAPGDKLPIADASVDFVVSSHVLEHFPDPIAALLEWYRIVRPDGYVYLIVPHRERTFDRGKTPTTLTSLQARHAGTETVVPDPETGHCSYWVTEDIVLLVRNIGLDWELVDFQDTDDKIGNGFAIVLRKGMLSADEREHIDLKWVQHQEKRQTLSASFFRPGSAVGRALELGGNVYREFLRCGLAGVSKRIKEFIHK